ncbi:MAG: hypothetical protein JKX75_07670, partial [Gammaproteobacteria bacterium]|nr:hypothetical protein [Gammaproteobacteria bacterium]
MESHAKMSYFNWFTFLFGILICQASVSSASTPDLFIHHAESIQGDIELLIDKTKNLDTSAHKRKHLVVRLEAAQKHIASGIDKYAQGIQKKAIKRFKKSRHSINRYLKLLAKYKSHHVIEPSVADQLKADAKKIRANITRLIKGDFSNGKPIANAGIDQSVVVGQIVTLDGNESYDRDGDVLTVYWTIISQPAASNIILSNPQSLTPSFTPVVTGVYIIELIVSDEQSSSTADTVAVNVLMAHINTAPVADAGLDQSVFTNQQVMFDGSGSTDVDGDALTWSWQMAAKPAGSNAVLSSEFVVQPTFVTDLIGQYVAQLIVNDGTDNSAPDSAVVNVMSPNTLPVANAGSDQADFIGNTITLDGSASLDADGDFLTHHWSFISVPTNSLAVLDNVFIARPSFLLDSPGDYVAQLIVNDGQADSAPDDIIVSTINSRPLAHAGNDQT